MDAVEEVKGRLNIEDVISEYVQLKRAGRNWKGLSPFSEEKSPSFMVSPEKQIWHDFSSGKGGNVFSFIMEVEGLTFKEALELLARKAGVDLDQYRTANKGTHGPNKDRLYRLLDLSTKFYQVQFSRNHTTLEYVLKKRRFSKETALEWRLGYSPNGGSALVDFLKGKGYSEAEIKSVGLGVEKRYGSKGMADMFRGRLMIPLCDPQGRVIGFTARLLADNPNAPKYINTPQTVLYDKSRHVFGLHLAKEAIRKSKFVVVAEGNLDVIASHQAGVRQVVATAGTALTEQHLQALSRFTGDIRLSFDADKAGLNATERAIPIASKAKVSLSIISIPSGKDPDELIKQDPEMWKKIIQDPEYALDWLIGRYKQQLDLSSGQGKRRFSDVILQVVRGLHDAVEQDHYIAAVAKLIGVSPDALRAKLQQTPEEPSVRPRALKKPKRPPAKSNPAQFDITRTANHLLSIALMQPKLRSIVVEPLQPDMIENEQARELFQFLQATPGFNGEAAQADTLRPIADYVKILGLHYEELYQGLEFMELQNEVARLQVHLIDRYVKMQKQHITAQLADADENKTVTLLTQVKELDRLLKTYKGGV